MPYDDALDDALDDETRGRGSERKGGERRLIFAKRRARRDLSRRSRKLSFSFVKRGVIASDLVDISSTSRRHLVDISSRSRRHLVDISSRSRRVSRVATAKEIGARRSYASRRDVAGFHDGTRHERLPSSSSSSSPPHPAIRLASQFIFAIDRYCYAPASDNEGNIPLDFRRLAERERGAKRARGSTAR